METVANEVHDTAIDDIVLVTQLPSQSWFEGFAMRPNGHILAARLDEPELYTWDPKNPDSEPTMLIEFPDASSAVNIVALPDNPDTYIAIAAIFSMACATECEDFVLWKVDFDPSKSADSPPTLTKILALDDVAMAIGVTPISGDTLLIADSFQASIFVVDLPTRSIHKLIGHDALMPASIDERFGINRMRLVDNHIWFTNNSKGIIGRIAIEQEPADGKYGGRSIRLSGPADADSSTRVQIVTSDVMHCDGLVVLPDGSAAYTASYNEGLLWRVDVNKETHEGTVTPIMSNLVYPTALELVTSGNKTRMYIICCGEIEPGWVTSHDRMSWSDLRGLDNCITEVTTTTEVVSQ